MQYHSIVLVRRLGFGQYYDWNRAEAFLPSQQPVKIPLSDWLFKHAAALAVDMGEVRKELLLDNVRPTMEVHKHWTCQIALGCRVNHRPEDVLTVARSTGNPIKALEDRISAAAAVALRVHDEDPRTAIRRSLSGVGVVAGLVLTYADIIDASPDEDIASAQMARDKADIIQVPAFLADNPEKFAELLTSGETGRLDLIKTLLKEFGDSPAGIKDAIRLFDREIERNRTRLASLGHESAGEVRDLRALLLRAVAEQESQRSGTASPMDARMRRLADEVQALQARFGSLDWDDAEGAWISIAVVPLRGALHVPATAVLIELPLEYPSLPPRSVFVNSGLIDPSGTAIPNDLHQEKGWDRLDIPDEPWDMERDSLLKIVDLVPNAIEAARRMKRG